MTRNQLEDLTDEEKALALVIVNDIAPPVLPKMTFEARHLTWFRHDQLIKKFIDVFPRLNPEGRATYVSLMHKLGVCVQIQQPPVCEASSSAAPTGSIAETTGSVSPNGEI